MSASDGELVEDRTPGFVTWQGNHWLMCYGRACIYLGEADAIDLVGWRSAVPSMFAGHNRDPDEIERTVEAIHRGDSPYA